MHKVEVTAVKADPRLVESGVRAELRQVEQRMTIKLDDHQARRHVLLAALRSMMMAH